jgi:uncharacterized protein
MTNQKPNLLAMENQYKQSYYVIASEPLNQVGQRILFSTRTGKALNVSSNVYEYLVKNEFSDLPQHVLDTLKDCEILVNDKENELLRIISENKDVTGKEDVLYEVIQPSAMCQFGCPYCGQEHKKSYLSSIHYASLLTRIENKLKGRVYIEFFIGWFGGEPLMGLKQMRELTILFKELADKYNIPYRSKIVTNGLSLKEGIFEELVNDLHVNSIEITLDGTAEYHDKKRFLKEGGDTFDLIFKNLLAICNKSNFSEYKCAISIRCNVDKSNVDGVTPLIALLAENNLQDKIAYFYPIGIYSWGGNDAQKASLTKEEFAELEIDWLLELIKHEFPVNLLPGRVNKVCLAVSPTSEMYDAYGNIFNCTEVSYTSFYEGTSYQLGNLKFPDDRVKVNRPLSDWNDEILNHKFPCSTCKMLPVCGGACPKSWHEDMRACPTNKFNIKDKLALSYILTKMEVAQLEI